ncbi:mpv17-like protein 2 [Maniola jurtina]|uniref:mpv17-like protein 2 n=1 Tax=Maniola jurtina TaxID=191418 RepID=UPI001E689329|nr:mpv17-like protein 2 [Maniola jurtina]XP_045764830.1 mpv17-like protein 2 [Maniola jurtina]
MFRISILKKLQPLVKVGHHKRTKSSFYRGVNFLFKKNLLLTNSITSGGFMAIGDWIQQEIEIHAKLLPAFDWPRVARMLIVGTVMGPLHHYYYIYLDKLLPLANLKTVAKKIAYDQLFASPATILCFFYGMGILEKKSLSQCTDEIKQKFAYTYVGDCLFWPPVQFVNFYYLPTHYRVFYINFATMIFNVFLSFIKHYDQHKHDS